ncbi:MAG: hypothetical protein IPK76_11040 [Lewinellaceae bacterium]|nr:hypothetical protein [Lewinellaceae bacterium]
MIDKIKLQTELKNFTGSEQVFYNPLFRKFRYTEGVKYLAKNQVKSFKLEFTDFPLEQIDLWFIEGTLILPSEY